MADDELGLPGGNVGGAAGSEDPYAVLADRFVSHYGTLRGAIRYRLVAEQLDGSMPAGRRLRIVDLGGGAGHQAFRLAERGHDVTLVDPSEAMLDHARARLQDFDASTRDRVTIVQATASEAAEVLGGQQFDVVCCHAVLPYVEDAGRLIGDVVALAVPGGLLSLLFKNRDALAMRPALEECWQDAVEAFEAGDDVGGMGVATKAHGLEEITDLLARAGATREAWFGVRVFTDHLGQRGIDDQFDAILRAERRAARTDPYRAVGRLLHLIARR